MAWLCLLALFSTGIVSFVELFCTDIVSSLKLTALRTVLVVLDGQVGEAGRSSDSRRQAHSIARNMTLTNREKRR